MFYKTKYKTLKGKETPCKNTFKAYHFFAN